MIRLPWIIGSIFSLLLVEDGIAGEATSPGAPAQPPLKEMSLEELGNLEVTSVSKRMEKLADAPATVFVITAEDIRRSNAATLPEVLRLAPNLEVAEIDAAQFAISARGFNINGSNKLLVLIDGRSVYAPLDSGVFWDSTDFPLCEIQRIEIISGPGGTIWGSNAVNGVINIITKSSVDSKGGTLEVGGGNWMRTLATTHWGGPVTNNVNLSVYGKYLDHEESIRQNGISGQDAWHRSQGGFRMEWAKDENSASIQGDVYDGRLGQLNAATASMQGQAVEARIMHAHSDDATFQFQTYYDHETRTYPNELRYDWNTLDLDFQGHFKTAGIHEFVGGGGFRIYQDSVQNSEVLAFLPARSDHRLGNLFVQDTLGFGSFSWTLGIKDEHNDYTGWELQPNVRFGWRLSAKEFLWASVSRAVRIPSRLDVDFFVPGASPYRLAGGPTFRSEDLLAYEAGYRGQPLPRLSFSASVFYNSYAHLRSLVYQASQSNYVIGNQLEGAAHGDEFWCDWVLTDAWRLRPGYSYLVEDLHPYPGTQYPVNPNEEGNDPKHRIFLRSLLNVGEKVEINLFLRHVSSLPSPYVPQYTALDGQFVCHSLPGLEAELMGQNLLGPRHSEFTTSGGASLTLFERQIMVKLKWNF